MKNWFNLKLLPFVRQTKLDFTPANKKQILADARQVDAGVHKFLQNNFDSEAPILNLWKTMVREGSIDVTADVRRAEACEDIVEIRSQNTDHPRIKCFSMVLGGSEHTYFLCPFCSNRVFAETGNCVFCDRQLNEIRPGGRAYADFISYIAPKSKVFAYKDRVKIPKVNDAVIHSNHSLDRFIPLKEPSISASAAFIPEDLNKYEEKSENLAPHISRKSFNQNPLATLQAISQIFRMRKTAVEGETTIPMQRGTRIVYESKAVAAEFIVSEKPHLYIYAKSEEAMARAIEKLETANIVKF